jgi:hypothetical protein
MKIPAFATIEELHKFLVENQDKIIAHKRDAVKYSESITGTCSLLTDEKGGTTKANQPLQSPPDAIRVKVVINTTGFMDSHKDVHMPGIWRKSLKENKNLVFLQEHVMAFDKIIADDADLNVYTEDIAWKAIGYKFEGTTQALIFEATIHKDRNPYMHEQYAKGRVRNHSVGMRYVDIVLCINNDNYGAEYEAWQKYYPHVANKDTADEEGYFWAVKAARAIEGSAVIIGSNTATPTLENNLGKQTTETTAAEHGTVKEQPANANKGIDYKYLKENFKI